MSTNNKILSVQELFFLTKEQKDKRGYWNRGLGRNKSYVLLFFCLQIIKTCQSRTIFLDTRTQGQKGDMGMECLIEINLMFFCSSV